MLNNSNDESVTNDQAVETAGAGESTTPAATERFNTCRWRCAPEDGLYCTHRDVLPFAGKDGFTPDSWCPECAFYKMRRTPKKRERNEYGY